MWFTTLAAANLKIRFMGFGLFMFRNLDIAMEFHPRVSWFNPYIVPMFFPLLTSMNHDIPSIFPDMSRKHPKSLTKSTRPRRFPPALTQACRACRDSKPEEIVRPLSPALAKSLSGAPQKSWEKLCSDKPGWWLTYPSEKYESVGMMTFPTEWKKKFQTTNQKQD